jgi:DtxR family transcriptional regulator, Mn-dependent transcriptional regulator
VTTRLRAKSLSWYLVQRDDVALTITTEDYLKEIAEAEADGETVISATLVRRLQRSAPAVTMATKRLKRDGYVRVLPGGRLQLTASGRAIADRLRNRHHLIERMLTEIFGMDWYLVHDEAERLEHAVSEDFEKRLQAKLGSKEDCPHGNRVSGDTPVERRKRGWKTLAELEADQPSVVVSVYERERQLLEYLDRLGIRPGAPLRITSRNYDETLTLVVEGRQVSLGSSVAGKVWVSPSAYSPRQS